MPIPVYYVLIATLHFYTLHNGYGIREQCFSLDSQVEVLDSAQVMLDRWESGMLRIIKIEYQADLASL